MLKPHKRKSISQIKKTPFDYLVELAEKLPSLRHNILLSNNLMCKLVAALTIKLDLLYFTGGKNNEKIAEYILVLLTSVSAMITLLFAPLLKVWYLVLIAFCLIFYFAINGLFSYLDKKTSIAVNQFPFALRKFSDFYATNKNVKKSLALAYPEMPKESGQIFCRLVQELSYSRDTVQTLRNFEKRINNIWISSFVELLITSIIGGSIEEDLMFINQLYADDIEDKEKTKSDLMSSKMQTRVINIITLVAFIINLLVNDIAPSLYFHTTIGKTIILVWLGSVVMSDLIFKYMESTS